MKGGDLGDMKSPHPLKGVFEVSEEVGISFIRNLKSAW
jgi:hypothetical protein